LRPEDAAFRQPWQGRSEQPPEHRACNLAGAAPGDIIGWHGFCETDACEMLDRGPRVGMQSPDIARA
jgi:hypothetical protein